MLVNYHGQEYPGNYPRHGDAVPILQQQQNKVSLCTWTNIFFGPPAAVQNMCVFSVVQQTLLPTGLTVNIRCRSRVNRQVLGLSRLLTGGHVDIGVRTEELLEVELTSTRPGVRSLFLHELLYYQLFTVYLWLPVGIVAFRNYYLDLGVTQRWNGKQ